MSVNMKDPNAENEIPEDTYEKSKDGIPEDQVNQEIQNGTSFNEVKDANVMLEDPNFGADLSYDHLMELAEENSPEAEEELKALAEQYNIIVNDGDTPHDLAMKIFQASEKEADNEELS